MAEWVHWAVYINKQKIVYNKYLNSEQSTTIFYLSKSSNISLEIHPSKSHAFKISIIIKIYLMFPQEKAYFFSE